jgi:hypothetical protein
LVHCIFFPSSMLMLSSILDLLGAGLVVGLATAALLLACRCLLIMVHQHHKLEPGTQARGEVQKRTCNHTIVHAPTTPYSPSSAARADKYDHLNAFLAGEERTRKAIEISMRIGNVHDPRGKDTKKYLPMRDHGCSSNVAEVAARELYGRGQAIMRDVRMASKKR